MPKPKRNRQKQIEVLSERPDFEEGQSVVRVARACGENIYEVEDQSGARILYQLPKRLRHVVFIKRGSYVFVRDDPTRGSNRVRGDIEVVVLDQFLNDLRTESFWPSPFARGNEGSGVGSSALPDDENEFSEQTHSDGGGNEWEVGGGNPNRRKWDHVSSDEESDG